MSTKILVIGSNSPHVIRFINLVTELFDEVVYIGEERLNVDFPLRQHLINFRSVNPFSVNKNCRSLKNIIRDENPTVAHIQQINRVAYFASKALDYNNCKYVVTAWGSDVLLVPKRNIFFRKLTQRVLNHAEFITADSLDMIEAIHRLSNNTKCRLVFLGINQIQSLPKQKIIYSNRILKPLYNIDGVIDEFYEFQQLNPDYKLVIGGDGALLHDLVEKVKKLGIQDKVDFVGWLGEAENNHYYQIASFYISLPCSDGTSVSLLEAMSAGCIPVVSDLPVAHEWIESGKNGIIKSSSQNALIEALTLNAKEVEKINVALIEEKATSKAATKNFKAIYDTLKHDSVNQK